MKEFGELCGNETHHRRENRVNRIVRHGIWRDVVVDEGKSFDRGGTATISASMFELKSSQRATLGVAQEYASGDSLELHPAEGFGVRWKLLRNRSVLRTVIED